MVYNGIGQGFKSKPRGKPFVKGNKNGKVVSEKQPDSGHKTSVRGDNLKPLNSSKPEAESVEENGIMFQLPKEAVENIKKAEEACAEAEKEDNSKKNVTVDSLDFFNGNNKLSIRFSKCHNRLFKIQMFLNDDTEMHRGTYTGSSSANSFWKMLKGNLK